MASQIIVSGCDYKYFPLVKELIDSVRQHEKGRHMPIAIIDGGMTTYQKRALEELGVIVVSPYIPAYVPKPELERRIDLSVNISKLWLNELFGQYETVLWIDADAWVQDFSAVELMFEAAASGHLAIVSEAGRFWSDQTPVRWIIPGFAQIRSFLYKSANRAGLSRDVKRNVAVKAALNAGVFALKTNAVHWKYLQTWQSKILRKGKVFTSDQLALSLVIYQDRLPVNLLPEWCNYLGPWRVNTDTVEIVEYFYPNRPVGIVHLAGQDLMRRNMHHRINVPNTSGFFQNMSLRYRRLDSDLLV